MDIAYAVDHEDSVQCVTISMPLTLATLTHNKRFWMKSGITTLTGDPWKLHTSTCSNLNSQRSVLLPRWTPCFLCDKQKVVVTKHRPNMAPSRVLTSHLKQYILNVFEASGHSDPFVSQCVYSTVLRQIQIHACGHTCASTRGRANNAHAHANTGVACACTSANKHTHAKIDINDCC